MKDILDIVFDTSNKIDNGRTVQSIGYAVSEEVGELSKEIRVKYMPDCYKTGDKDGILGEACDILISTIDLMYVEGCSKEDIINTIVKKTNAWKNKATGSNKKISKKALEIIQIINNHKVNMLRIYNYMLNNLKCNNFNLCETLYNSRDKFISHDDYILNNDVLLTLEKFIPNMDSTRVDNTNKVIEYCNKVAEFDTHNIKYYSKHKIEITDGVILECIADLLDTYLSHSKAFKGMNFSRYVTTVLRFYIPQNKCNEFSNLINDIQKDLDIYDVDGFSELLHTAYF